MGIFFKELGLHFELYYGNGLVHKCRKPHCFFIEFHRLATALRNELLACGVAISFHCKSGKRHKVDAVAFFERGEVGIA